jgi:hypothetical protein
MKEHVKLVEALKGVTKSSINGLYNLDKDEDSFLHDDLERITVIRIIIEENTNYAMSILEDIDSNQFETELKEYAKMLFCKLCMEERGEEGDNLDNEELIKEDESFFDYVYTKLEYPDLK